MGQPGNLGRAVPRVEGGPLADRVRSVVLEAILDGRFAERLPAEGDLAKMLDVSRTTLRTALSGLERDGIVTRRRAVGTTINSHAAGALALQRHVGFDWVLRKSGRSVQVAVTYAVGAPPDELAAIFGLDTAAEYLAIDKEYRADGAVAVWLRDVLPMSALRLPLPDGDVPTSLSEVTRQFGHRSVDHAVARMAATVKEDGITRLAIDQGRPFTRLLETHYSTDAEVVGYSVIDVDDGLVQLEVFRREAR